MRFRSDNQNFCLVIVTPGCRRTFSTLPERLRKTADCSSWSIEKYSASISRTTSPRGSRRTSQRLRIIGPQTSRSGPSVAYGRGLSLPQRAITLSPVFFQHPCVQDRTLTLNYFDALRWSFGYEEVNILRVGQSFPAPPIGRASSISRGRDSLTVSPLRRRSRMPVPQSPKMARKSSDSVPVLTLHHRCVSSPATAVKCRYSGVRPACLPKSSGA